MTPRATNLWRSSRTAAGPAHRGSLLSTPTDRRCGCSGSAARRASPSAPASTSGSACPAASGRTSASPRPRTNRTWTSPSSSAPAARVTPALFALGVGAAVDIDRAAKGKLQLDADADHHLMVATVTGIAPLRSMLLDALHAGTRAHASPSSSAPATRPSCPSTTSSRRWPPRDPRVTYQATVSRPDAPGRPARGAAPSAGSTTLARPWPPSSIPATTHVYAVGHSGMIAVGPIHARSARLPDQHRVLRRLSGGSGRPATNTADPRSARREIRPSARSGHRPGAAGARTGGPAQARATNTADPRSARRKIRPSARSGARPGAA